MRKSILTLTIVCVALISSYNLGQARAQYAMPNFAAGMNQMMANQMQMHAYGNYMAQQAAQQFLQERLAYRAQTGNWTGYLPGPVSAAQLSNSIAEMNQAYDEYNNAWARNSQIQDQAVARWTRGAIRGTQMYDGYGGQVELPYGHERTWSNGSGEYVQGGYDYDPNDYSCEYWEEVHPTY